MSEKRRLQRVADDDDAALPAAAAAQAHALVHAEAEAEAEAAARRHRSSHCWEAYELRDGKLMALFTMHVSVRFWRFVWNALFFD